MTYCELKALSPGQNWKYSTFSYFHLFVKTTKKNSSTPKFCIVLSQQTKEWETQCCSVFGVSFIKTWTIKYWITIIHPEAGNTQPTVKSLQETKLDNVNLTTNSTTFKQETTKQKNEALWQKRVTQDLACYTVL